MDRTLKIVFAFMAAAAARAEDASAGQPADTSSIILAPKPTPAPAATPAPVPAVHPPLSGISAVISAGMPAYSPPTPAPKDGAVAAPETDKPKNQIPRLPLEVMSRYVVRGARIPTFRTRDLYTKEGLIDLSFKEHPGLRIGNFFNLNAPIAYARMRDELELADRLDIADLAHAMAVGGDSSEGAEAQQAIIDESFESAVGQGGPVGIK